MTHDELLKKIDDEAMLGNKEWKAFRAVIELHKPVMQWSGGYDGEDNPLYAEQCSDCSGNGFTQEYFPFDRYFHFLVELFYFLLVLAYWGNLSRLILPPEHIIVLVISKE